MSPSNPTIQTFASYVDARQALERLLDHDVPTSAVSISARGIRLVEEVQPQGWLHAAGEGALNGATVGLLVGFLIGLFSPSAPGFSALVLGFWGALIGAVAGVVIALIVHALRRDEGGHTMERSLTAERFDLRVADDHLNHARRILAAIDTQSQAAA